MLFLKFSQCNSLKLMLFVTFPNVLTLNKNWIEKLNWIESRTEEGNTNLIRGLRKAIQIWLKDWGRQYKSDSRTVEGNTKLTRGLWKAIQIWLKDWGRQYKSDLRSVEGNTNLTRGLRKAIQIWIKDCGRQYKTDSTFWQVLWERLRQCIIHVGAINVLRLLSKFELLKCSAEWIFKYL